jgi:hypothetical protein
MEPDLSAWPGSCNHRCTGGFAYGLCCILTKGFLMPTAGSEKSEDPGEDPRQAAAGLGAAAAGQLAEQMLQTLKAELQALGFDVGCAPGPAAPAAADVLSSSSAGVGGVQLG